MSGAGTANDEGYNDRCSEYQSSGSNYSSKSPPALALKGNTKRGKATFIGAGCGGCHVLSDAKTTASVGPNLTRSNESFERVVYRVTLGLGNMPSFETKLNPQQIADVSAYVAEMSGP